MHDLNEMSDAIDLFHCSSSDFALHFMLQIGKVTITVTGKVGNGTYGRHVTCACSTSRLILQNWNAVLLIVLFDGRNRYGAVRMLLNVL